MNANSAPAALLAPYPDLEALQQRTRALADGCGGRVSTYGHSVEGRALTAVCVPAGRDGVPRVLCAASIHGVEHIGPAVALGVLEQAAVADSPVGRLRQQAELWVLPCLNPDGFARTHAQSGVGTLKQLRANAHGVDLNRNFPVPGGQRASSLPGAGSQNPRSATYRGPAPLSEPETMHLDALCAEREFHAAVSLHSFMGTLIPARVTDAAGFAGYRELCAAFSAAQRGPVYRRLASRWLDVFTGELEDHLHHTRRCWAVCVEVFPVLHSVRQHLRAPSLFWRFNPRDPAGYVANDVPAVAAFLSAALSRPRPPS